ncbi:hypothetical protein O9H85_01815 [Paenibacillus filicis]|uniref:DUF4190 domain-containing protein n=1 Tax=Paenibacillus gyeongsangnamensis TaxID=3388067 RepID=A0ABT4Q2U3_9BACL|nr:hypothetical protein [Paenibacillus filicis]MCZ8511194.1 hypothetical protein [Paenibacillus filicis]
MSDIDRKISEASSDTKDASHKRFKQDRLHRESGGDNWEEYAAEVAPYMPLRETAAPETPVRQEDNPAPEERSRWAGYSALILGLLSLLILPTFLGFASIALGALAYFRGQRALGIWSVVLGLIALAGYILLVPLYA